MEAESRPGCGTRNAQENRRRIVRLVQLLDLVRRVSPHTEKSPSGRGVRRNGDRDLECCLAPGRKVLGDEARQQRVEGIDNESLDSRISWNAMGATAFP